MLRPTAARPSISSTDPTEPTFLPAMRTSAPGTRLIALVKLARSLWCPPEPVITITVATTPARSAPSASRLAPIRDPRVRSPEQRREHAADDVDEDQVDDHRPRGRASDPHRSAARPVAVVHPDEPDRRREAHALDERVKVVLQRLR